MYKKKLRQKAKQLREEGDERAVNVMKLKMRGVLDQYSAEMKIAIGSKMDGSPHLQRKDPDAVKESDSDDQAAKESDPEERENDKKIAEMLDLSQKYMESNCNAACNNMSLLTLHAFEVGNIVQRKQEDQKLKKKITDNIVSHAE